jgi:glucose/arabinose dehydrogenase
MNRPARILTGCAILSIALSLTACDSDNGLIPPNREPGPAAPDLALTQIAAGLVQPVDIAHAGDGSGRLFIVERAGRVWVVDDGAIQPTAFLDIRGRVRAVAAEQGLLGIAFPPGFTGDGPVYVYYTSEAGPTAVGAVLAGDTIVSRFTVDGGLADPSTEAILLHVAQPFANHNGGQLAFGPDGYLYIALGDGGSSGDPQGHGQNTGTLLGALLRIDVESDPVPDLYVIPADNPLVDEPGARGEIWAFGLRNPWRFSFDRETGDLYIGDVGQESYEEINFQPAASGGGENYGWNIMEGMHCYPPPTVGCDQQGLTLPVAEYDNASGDCAVTGGYVYRGAQYPALQGYYLYGDYCSGRIRGFRIDPDGAAQDAFMTETGRAISTFGEDEDGNLYLADYNNGILFRIDLQ